MSVCQYMAVRPHHSDWIQQHFDRGHIASLRGDLRRFDCEFTRLCCDRSASGNSMLSAWRSIKKLWRMTGGPLPYRAQSLRADGLQDR